MQYVDSRDQWDFVLNEKGKIIGVRNQTGTITLFNDTASSGGVTDGDKGHIIVSNDGATWTIDKVGAGLNLVDNTPDLQKPISQAVQAELDVRQAKSAILDNTTASYTASKDLKLSGIADNATANSTDAQLRDRSTHTGTQASSTISDFANTVRATVLTGLSTATNSAVLATDTILQGIGKLQAQVTARASLAVANVFTALNRFRQTTCPFTTITWSSTIAPDLSQGQAFVVTATGATTLNAPTNVDGANFQSFQLEFIQATSGATLGFNTAVYEASGGVFPTVTATANADTVLLFNRLSNGKFVVSAITDTRSA